MGCGASKDSAVNATPDSRAAECCNSKKKKKRIKHKDEEKEVPREVGAVSTSENPVAEVPNTIDETRSGNAGVVELIARGPSPLQQDNLLQSSEQVVASSPTTKVRTPPPVEQGHDEPQTEVITPEQSTPQKDEPERGLGSPAAENETKIHITAPSPLRLKNQVSRTPSPAPRAKIVAGSRTSSPVSESKTSSPAQSVSRTSSPAPPIAESRTSSPAQLVANSRTSSPAQLVTESRASSPAQLVAESRNSSQAQLVAESRISSPAQLVAKSRTSSPLIASSRTSSPAHLLADFRTSSPADSRALSPAQLAAESRTSSPAHVAESRTSSSAQVVPESRTSSPAESRTSSPAQSKASSPVQLVNDFKNQLNRSPSPGQIALSQASRTPSPAQSTSESMGYASRSASPAQLSELKGQVSRTAPPQLSEASISESKSLLSRTPSPAQASTVPKRTPSPAPQIPVSKIELRKPSPAEQIALSQEKLKSQFRSPSPAEQQDKLHINRTKELPLSRPQSNNEQLPVDAHNVSRTLSRSSVVSLKDSRSSSRSPALSQKDSTPSSKSPAMSRQDSRASSQSPALSRKASFGLADEEGNFLSESAAAALRAIVQSVTDELAEKAGNDHDWHEDDVESSVTKERDEVDALKKEKNLEAERQADEHEKDETVSPPSNDVDDLTASQHLESILSRVEIKKKQQNVAGATGSSPRPGLLQYYLGLRSGEYKLSSPSSSASSLRETVAGMKDSLEDIDLTRDLPDNVATSPKVRSPALDVESIYNEIRKLTFSEYDKLEDTNSNYEGSIEQVETVSTTKVQMLVDKEQLSSPLSSKDSVDEGVPDAPSLTNTRLSSILDEYAET